jgi:hypothetical protein
VDSKITRVIPISRAQKSKSHDALLVIAKLSVFAIGKPIGVQFVFGDIDPDGIINLYFFKPCLVMQA